MNWRYFERHIFLIVLKDTESCPIFYGKIMKLQANLILLTIRQCIKLLSRCVGLIKFGRNGKS